MSTNRIIAQSFFSKAKDASIVSVISNFLPDLKHKGASFIAHCPFHKEKTPSFHVNDQKNYFKCFGCGEGGDAIAFVMKHEDINYVEACKTIANIVGIPIEYEEREYSEKEKEINDDAQRQEEVLNCVIPFYQKNLFELPEDHPAKKYVKQRFSEDIISEFQIGYGGDYGKGVKTHLINKNLFEPAEKIGILVSSNGKIFDGYHDRITFPIRDKNGKHVGLGGRIVNSGPSNKNIPKYINSKDCELYHKKENVFGLNYAGKAIRKEGKAIIVEGYADVMSCHAIGQQNVVGTLGTALTREQIQLLKRSTSEIDLMFDNDQAGNEASGKVLPELLKQDFRVNTILYDKKYKDPDSLVTALKDEAFKNVTSTDAILYRAKAIWENANGDIYDQGEAMSEISDLLCCIASETIRTGYVDKIQKELKIKLSLLKNALKTKIARVEKENALKLKKEEGENNQEAFSSIEFKNGRIYSRVKGKQISNFTIKIHFHVQTGDDLAFRVVIITNIQGSRSTILMNSDDGVSKGPFKKIIARHGNYVFKGTDDELTDLMELLQKEEKPCIRIDMMGWNAQHKLYAFCNGIVTFTENNANFLPVDNYGIVQHEGKYFFIPANSDIYTYKGDTYQNERKFKKRAQRENFPIEKWANLFYRAYGEKSKVAITFFMAALFRDIIFKHTSRFPILNLYGPPGYGKGAFAESLLHMWGDRQDPIMLGAGSTSVGFGRRVSSLSNALILIDEYKNNLDPKLIEALKGIYDGKGRTTGKKTNDVQTNSIIVHSAIVLAGQHMPTADIALFSRCTLLSFCEKNFSKEQKESFAILKEMEEDGGFSDITFLLLRYRHLIEANFRKSYELISKQIFQEVAADGIDDRMIINISMMLTVFYILKDQMEFPFTYKECQSFFIENMKYQHSISIGNDDVSKFWAIVENLASQRQILYDKHFFIKDGYLYIRISDIHPLYVKESRHRGDTNYLSSESSLRHYLSLNKQSYVEKTRQRFKEELEGENSRRCDKFRYKSLDIDLPLHNDKDSGLFPGKNQEETEDLPF